MNRTDRLIAIVLLLHSRKVVRARDIADHFEINIRTVYRDMKALNEAGVPVAAEAGEGYSLAPGYHLPPVMFTRDEAGALFLGAELARQFTDASLRQHVESAAAKIQAVLPEEKKEFLEKLDAATIVAPPSRFREGFRNDVLRTIQDAVVRRQILSIEYFSNHRDSFTSRKVEPLGLLYYSNYWHLIAYCRWRKDYRDFRTDRIKSLVMQDEVFAERADFSLEKFLEQTREMEAPHEAKVKFKDSVVSYVRGRYYFGAVTEEPAPDGIVLTFKVPSYEMLSGWLLSFGDQAEALSPPELIAMIARSAEKVVSMYKPVS